MAGETRGPDKGDPRAAENGRRGGQKTRDTRGPDYFREIGRKGGRATMAKHGPEHLADIGRKGGTTRKESADFAELGRLSAEARRRSKA